MIDNSGEGKVWKKALKKKKKKKKETIKIILKNIVRKDRFQFEISQLSLRSWGKS